MSTISDKIFMSWKKKQNKKQNNEVVIRLIKTDQNK